MAHEGAPLSPRPLGDDSRAHLVGRYRAPLIRYFWRRGAPSADAEDLAQDCFARVFALARCDHIQNEEAYLFQIASHVLADYVQGVARRHGGRHVPIDQVQIDEETAEVNSPDRVLEGKEALTRFAAALKELKPKTREIFLLNRMDGLTYTQIAVRFGLTPSAIEKHMIAALAHLHKRLADLKPRCSRRGVSRADISKDWRK